MNPTPRLQTFLEVYWAWKWKAVALKWASFAKLYIIHISRPPNWRITRPVPPPHFRKYGKFLLFWWWNNRISLKMKVFNNTNSSSISQLFFRFINFFLYVLEQIHNNFCSLSFSEFFLCSLRLPIFGLIWSSWGHHTGLDINNRDKCEQIKMLKWSCIPLIHRHSCTVRSVSPRSSVSRSGEGRTPRACVGRYILRGFPTNPRRWLMWPLIRPTEDGREQKKKTRCMYSD